MSKTTSRCTGRHKLLCTPVNWLNMLILSCSWEEVRRLHGQQPSLDHRDVAMTTTNREKVLMHAAVKVVKVVKGAMLL